MHLQRVKAHPVQETPEQIETFVRGTGVKKHVTDIVKNRLLKPHSKLLNPPKRSKGTPYSTTYTVLQYITRTDLKIKDSRHKFDGEIQKHLVKFIKDTFFNKAYLKKVLDFQKRSVASTSDCTQARQKLVCVLYLVLVITCLQSL